MNEHDEDTTDVLAELRAIAAEVEMAPTTWSQPPPGLWERIAAETGATMVADALGSAAAEPATPTETFEPLPAAPVAPIAPVMPLRHPRRPLPWILGAAAAVVALVIGISVFVGGTTDSDVVASVTLDQLGDAGSGNAELIDQDGQYRLKVSTADLDPGDGFLEVWVIDTDVSKLVSLGPARPDGTYDLPPGMDPQQFPVVDVSVEPLDGNPAHSGDSVLRGTLTF